MERVEAANFLGVSVSTLDRMASQGRLTRGRAKRKTRPVTVFDRGELERLKADLEHSMRPVKAQSSGSRNVGAAIGFRLDSHYAERLKVEGAKLGSSASVYARKLLIQSLEDDRSEEFRREVSALRNNLAEVFYLILVTKLGASENDAREVVSGLLEKR